MVFKRGQKHNLYVHWITGCLADAPEQFLTSLCNTVCNTKLHRRTSTNITWRWIGHMTSTQSSVMDSWWPEENHQTRDNCEGNEGIVMVLGPSGIDGLQIVCMKRDWKRPHVSLVVTRALYTQRLHNHCNDVTSLYLLLIYTEQQQGIILPSHILISDSEVLRVLRLGGSVTRNRALSNFTIWYNSIW